MAGQDGTGSKTMSTWATPQGFQDPKTFKHFENHCRTCPTEPAFSRTADQTLKNQKRNKCSFRTPTPQIMAVQPMKATPAPKRPEAGKKHRQGSKKKEQADP